jgi:hypothetical protein
MARLDGALLLRQIECPPLDATNTASIRHSGCHT